MHDDIKRYVNLFKEEAGEYLERLSTLVIELEKDPGDKDILTEVFRIFHTIKGMSATLNYREIERISHEIEETLEEVKESGEVLSKELIDRVFKGMDAIEELISNIGKDVEKDRVKSAPKSPVIKIILEEDIGMPAARAMVIIKAIEREQVIEEINPSYEDIKSGKIEDIFWIRCSNSEIIKKKIETMEGIKEVKIIKEEEEGRASISGTGGIRVNVALLDLLQNIVGELVISFSQLTTLLKEDGDRKHKKVLELHNRSIGDLQEIVARVRLVPLSLIFNKFPRYVRDLSGKLGKEMSIDIHGADIKVDRSLLEGISDPLIHLIRNAIDHGIEFQEERKMLNKSILGKITVTAKRVKGDILIEINDDGRGIDEKAVLHRAYMKGLLEEGEIDSITKKEILRFLFIPGFTTSEEVSRVSGRGIGLDVVKEALRSVGGSVDILTEKNKGTTVSMKMPLSMAIIKVYLVGAGGRLFALPMTFVDETFTFSESSLSFLMLREVMILRNSVLPVYHLSDVMGIIHNDEKRNTDLSCMVIEVENDRFVLIVDKFYGSRDVVVKPLPAPLNTIEEYTGITIVGDGEPCLILDLPGIRYRRKYENTGS